MQELLNTESFDKIKRIGIFQTIDDLVENRFHHLKYVCYRFLDKTYFGPYLAATQGNAIRHYYMQEVVRNYCKNHDKDIKILEIGSWAGNSAITWAEAIKLYSTKQGKVFCIDPWTDYMHYIEPAKDRQWIYRTMKKAFQNDNIYKLFLHNILSSKHSDILSILRGSSSDILPMLKDNQFDLIFIDGNHTCEFVYNDIKNSAPLVKNGGILCGDDLELQYSEVDTDTIIKMINKDVIIDPLTKKRYHPGVTLGVYKYFKKDISSWEGFYAIQKEGNSWRNISIDIEQKKINIPKYSI